jgi:hypothetical protein
MTRIVVLQQIGHIFEHRHSPLVKFYGIPLTNMTGEEVAIIKVNESWRVHSKSFDVKGSGSRFEYCYVTRAKIDLYQSGTAHGHIFD